MAKLNLNFKLPFNFETLLYNIGSILRGKSDEGIISPIPDASPTPTPEIFPDRKALEEGIEHVYKKNMPPSMRETTPVQEYYPVAKHFPEFMEKEDIRPGAGVLGALQALYESTGGRATSNVFGAKPKGKAGQKFGSIPEAIDYQYGPDVLGGGVDNKLNILQGKGPITPDEISKLYESYNPEMAYLQGLLRDFLDVTGKEGGGGYNEQALKTR